MIKRVLLRTFEKLPLKDFWNVLSSDVEVDKSYHREESKIVYLNFWDLFRFSKL